MEQRVIGRRAWLDAGEIRALDALEREEALDIAARRPPTVPRRSTNTRKLTTRDERRGR